MRVARVAAQAKINLWLRVGPPDGRGYHEISTLFQRIDLADEIIVRAGEATSRALECSGPRMPPGGLGPEKKNLAFRAAEAFHARAGWPRGFSIELTKNIPVGGGLGGGSADAAAVLRALNALAPNPLDDARLHAIALSLGSDVPFLASNHVRAVGTGRGDELVGFSSLPDAAVLLVVPRFGVATADAYRWIDAAGPRALPLESELEDAQVRPAPVSWSFSWGNDFEPVVEQRHPELRGFRERLLQAGAKLARLSGSGSTVFGIFDDIQTPPGDLGLDALVIPTRTSSRVVQVDVLE